jgi:hypothetical protein
MEPLISVNRLDMGMKNGKVFQFIALGLLLFSLSLLLVMEEIEFVIVAIVFATMLYFFFKLQEIDKIVFYEDYMQHTYFGKVKKTIHYKDIVEVSGIESALNQRPLQHHEAHEEPIELLGSMKMANSTTRISFIKMSVAKLSQLNKKNSFRFIVVAKEGFPNFKIYQHVIRTLNRNKNIIVMHFNQEVYDFLKQKKLV